MTRLGRLSALKRSCSPDEALAQSESPIGICGGRLSLSVRVNQHVVGDGSGFGADAQEGSEGGFRGVASIEANRGGSDAWVAKYSAQR